MKNKKRCFRLFSALVICMILVSATCPAAFAAPVYLDHQYSFDIELSQSGFKQQYSQDGSFTYYHTVDLTGKLQESAGLFVSLTFQGWYGTELDESCTIMKRAEFLSYTLVSSGTEVYLLGDQSLYSSALESNGSGFVLVCNLKNPAASKLVVSPKFYSNLFLRSTGMITDPDYNITVHAEPGNSSDFVAPGMTSSLNWVGRFISSLISPDGALAGLLPMLAIIVAVPALILGIKVIRSIIWGS